MSKYIILFHLVILSYNCNGQLPKLTDILSTAHQSVDQVAGAVLGGLGQGFNLNIGGHYNYGNGRPTTQNNRPFQRPPPPPQQDNGVTTEEVIIVVVEEDPNAGQYGYNYGPQNNNRPPPPPHHKPPHHHHKPPPPQHMPPPPQHMPPPPHHMPPPPHHMPPPPHHRPHHHRPPPPDNRPGYGYRPPNYGYNNGQTPYEYGSNEQTNPCQNGNGNFQASNYGNTNNYGIPSNECNGETTGYIEKQTEKTKPGYGDIKPTPPSVPNYETTNPAPGNDKNTQKPIDNSNKIENQNVNKETTKKPNGDAPIFIPLKPNEYQYGGDKINVSEPTSDTGTDKQNEDDEEFSIDVRNRDE